MNKYTRSKTIVTAIIKDIFDDTTISLDTKAIILVLAATMDQDKFIQLVATVDGLEPVRPRLLELNQYRHRYGISIRDLIIMQALVAADRDISSDELQLFISDVTSIADQKSSMQLAPALDLGQIMTEQNWRDSVDAQGFAATKKMAAFYLVDRLATDSHNDANLITETFLYCRLNQKPLVAYYSVIYAMTDILINSGLDAKFALIYSYKLAKHSLEKFIQQEEHKNLILHAYKS